VSKTTALAAYAAGKAMLGEHEDAEAVVDELSDIVDGDTTVLVDARDLLVSTRAEPDRIERATLLIERAITRIEQQQRAHVTSERLRSSAAETSASSQRLQRSCSDSRS
jgi:hypothetical protein